MFIDELDRCRPDFAVRTLERIKHLFEVPELSFVLLLHTPQLQHAVQGLYGAIDAEGYLRKFIHFTLPLPRVEVQPGKTPEVVAYVKYLGQKVSLGEAQTNVSRFVEVYGYIAPLLNMSMRDVERAFLAFILSNPRPQMYPVLVDCLACIVAIKVLRPGVYAALVRRDAAAAGEAIQMFSAPVVDGVPKYYEQLMRYVLEAHVTRNPSQDALGYWSQMRMITGPRVEHVFTMLTSRN